MAMNNMKKYEGNKSAIKNSLALMISRGCKINYGINTGERWDSNPRLSEPQSDVLTN